MIARTFILVVWLSIIPDAAYAELSVETFDDTDRYPESFTNNLKADDGSTIVLVGGRGLELAECGPNDCVGTLSHPRIARGRSIDEFNFREPIFLGFLGSQRTVGVQVRSDRQYNPPQRIRASLVARTQDGYAIARDDVEFNSDEGWQPLFLVNFFPQFVSIKSVEILGGRAVLDPSVNDNFIAIDDLQFDRTTQTAGDGRAPRVTINLINADPFTGNRLVIETNVTDQSQLDTVVGHVTQVGTNAEIDSFEFCGTANADRCPNTAPTDYIGQTFADLAAAPDNTYEAHVIACDIWGNCDDDRELFVVAKIPPPSPPIIEAVEVSQGVASGYDNDVPGPEDAPHEYSPLGIPAYLIQGKNTLVRFYPYASGVVDPDAPPSYSASLAVSIPSADGHVFVDDFPQNIAPASVSLPPRPFTAELVLADLADRRVTADAGGALNFVIPGSLLRDAETIDLQLRSNEPNAPATNITGTISVRLRRPVAIGINVARIHLRGKQNELAEETVQDRIADLNALLPVTEVVAASRRFLRVANCDGLRDDECCYRIRRDVWGTVETDTAPRYPGSIEDNVTFWVGFIPLDAFGAGDPLKGCADVDMGRTAIVVPSPIAVAHEVGHSIGLLHAGDDHGEEDFIQWPEPHGRVGITDVGVWLKPQFEDPVPFGRWQFRANAADLFFDPCPVDSDTGGTRYPCSLADDDETPFHDIMSYGTPSWWSRLNWNGFYNRVLLLSAAPTQGFAQALSETTETTVDALLVSGIIDQANGTFYPLIRKRVPSELVSEPTKPDATLELFGRDEGLLQSTAVRLRTMADLSDSEIPRLLAIVPFVDGVTHLRLTHGETVLDKQASANAPRVKVLNPDGGEQITSGIVNVSWEAEDADGDPLTFLVQYSPDGGASWQSIGLRSSEDPFEISFGAGELPASTNAKIRVHASDGIRLAEDFSDCPFSLRGGKPEDCSVDLDVRPGSCPNPLKPAGKGVIPVVILGSDRIDVSAIDTSSLALEGVPAKHTSLRDIDSDGACDKKIMDDITDLVVQFDLSDVADALRERLGREPLSGEVLDVTLTGQIETGSATASISGKDSMTIVGD